MKRHTIEEIEQIKQVKARYFRLMGQKRWDEWKELFTEDVIPLRSGGKSCGRTLPKGTRFCARSLYTWSQSRAGTEPVHGAKTRVPREPTAAFPRCGSRARA